MNPVTARIAAYAALVLSIFFGGVYVEHRFAAARYEALELKVDNERIAAQAAADKKTLELQAQAAKAHADYEKTQADLKSYVDSHPVGDVRLCLSPSAVSAAGKAGAKPGTGTAPAAPGDVLKVPPGDSGVRQDAGPDIGGMLSALADKADELNSQLREQKELAK